MIGNVGGSNDVIARMLCLGLALAILGIGISQASLTLMVLAALLVAMSLARLKTADVARAPIPRTSSGCSDESVSSRAMMIAVGAAGLSALAVALGSGDALVGI